MDNWLTLREAEELTGIKHNTFGSYITREKVIPENKRIKKGNMWLIDREWLEEKYADKIKEMEQATDRKL